MKRNIVYSVLCALCGQHWYCSGIADQPARDIEKLFLDYNRDFSCPFCNEVGPKEIVDINDEYQNSLDLNSLALRLGKRIEASHIAKDKAKSFIEQPLFEKDRVELNIKVFKDKQEYLYYKIIGEDGFVRKINIAGPVDDVQKLKKDLKEDFYFGIPVKGMSVTQEFSSGLLAIELKEY